MVCGELLLSPSVVVDVSSISSAPTLVCCLGDSKVGVGTHGLFSALSSLLTVDDAVKPDEVGG